MIKSIDQRLSIVEQVASEILKIQYSFFNNDSDELIPLNMKRIAEKLDVHETTVSRATSDKYIKTSRGIFEMSISIFLLLKISIVLLITVRERKKMENLNRLTILSKE